MWSWPLQAARRPSTSSIVSRINKMVKMLIERVVKALGDKRKVGSGFEFEAGQQKSSGGDINNSNSGHDSGGTAKCGSKLVSIFH